jgi:hypothetical protein
MMMMMRPVWKSEIVTLVFFSFFSFQEYSTIRTTCIH